VFGFLVWELKENWRLYEANRPETLRPVVFGDHGETMARLLRPGIHSGTLPKLFAKLRKSERRAQGRGDEKGAFKRLESLHHVEESIRRFVERDFIALLGLSRTLRPAAIRVSAVHVATNQVRIELRTALAEEPDAVLEVEFDEIHDALIAGLAGPGWLPVLSEEQARVLSIALIGLFKKGVADWVRVLPDAHARSGGVPELASVAFPEIEWHADGHDAPVPLDRPDSAPGRGGAGTAQGVPAVPTLLPLNSVVVTWRRWVEAWEREQAGARHPARFLEGYSVLPRSPTTRDRRPRSAPGHP
jgi:hypothetical protein